MKHGTIIALVLVTTAVLHSPSRALDDVGVPNSVDLRAWMTHLAQLDAQPLATVSEHPFSGIARFYQRVGYQPVWTGPDGLLPQGELLLETLTKASTAGLHWGNYLLRLLKQHGWISSMDLMILAWMQLHPTFNGISFSQTEYYAMRGMFTRKSCSRRDLRHLAYCKESHLQGHPRGVGPVRDR